jgi:hypothetical protein
MTPTDTTIAYQLLQIVEKSAAHAGKLGNLQSWATDELMKMNTKLRDEAQAKAKADQAEAAKKAATDLRQPNDDHKVDPNFGAPRAAPLPPQGPRPEVSGQAPRTAPAAELQGATPTTPDRRA